MSKKGETKIPSSKEFRSGLTKLGELRGQFNTEQDQEVEKEQPSLEDEIPPEKEGLKPKEREEEKRLSHEEFKRLLSELREQVAKSEPKWEIEPPHLRKKRQEEEAKPEEKREVDPILREKLLKGINNEKLVDRIIQRFSEDILWQTVEKFEARTEEVEASPG